MKLGVLFTGGKDSCYALYKAMEKHDIKCLISVISENKESYMFHTPNISITDLQAKSTGLPLLKQVTKGEKEKELKDLEIVIEKAVKKYKIEGIVTGAVESVYQATRVQKICNKLGLWCFNPLWKRDQEELLKEIVDEKFKVIISGVFAYPLDFQWLGKVIDKNVIERLIELYHGKYEISPTGEGGEYESTVLNAPFFKKEIEIIDFEVVDMIDSGVYNIKGRLK